MIRELVNRLLSFFGVGTESANAAADFRRRYIRHNGVHAEVTVGNRAYSIRDWSLGGVSFETAPDASLTVGDRLQLTLKFRFLHGTITIQQQAHVVRAARRGIAAKFAPLPKGVRTQFDRVIDSLNTESFMESQAA